MIAHLPMYDTAANKAAHDIFWDALRQHIPDLPDRSNTNDLWHDWKSPDLLLSQTCGLPFRHSLHMTTHLIGTPDNRLENCPPGHYRSALVASKGISLDLTSNDFRLAVNDALSQSGWGAPWAEGITGKTRDITGSHLASVQAVLEGEADVAAVDALTWKFLRRDTSWANDLQVMTWTRPTPTLPFITNQANRVNELKKGIRAAIHDVGSKVRSHLNIFDLIEIPSETYLKYPVPPKP